MVAAVPALPTPELTALAARTIDLRDAFNTDVRRATRWQLEAAGLCLDLSTQRIDDAVMAALAEYAGQCGLSEAREALFAGARVNITEDRAAAHMALRAPPGMPYAVAGSDVSGAVHDVLAAMSLFTARVRSGEWRGATGEAITDVVNIGIGGSDLGPRMVVTALGEPQATPRAHFVANVDPVDLRDTLAGLRPERTLFVVTSKTFTTQETLANAHRAREWLSAALPGEGLRQHFAAVTTNIAGAEAFGIPESQCFGFWDWVGGRYSVWSAVGLSVMLALGEARFRALLAGAWAMDQHFRDVPIAHNLPARMAMVAWWNHRALQLGSQVVVPYAERLQYFVPWLQQLEMESNGKGVTRDGQSAVASAVPVWGGVGSNGQHAYFQMLHQGPTAHPVDFIVVAAPMSEAPDDQAGHRLLLANALAQRAALMLGKAGDAVDAELEARGLSAAQRAALVPHRSFTGNRPSSLLVVPKLDAYHLGALMAAYEHRTFVLSILWNVHPFDQWGVELGKGIAREVDTALAGGPAQLDTSSAYWAQRFRRSQGSAD